MEADLGRQAPRRTVRLARRSPGGRVYQQTPLDPPQDWGAIARIYDLEHPAARGAELRFWDEQAKVTQEAGAVLELAAGSGRIAIALARKGHRVTGLELSEGMLERARARTSHLPETVQESLRWVSGDMSAFDLSGERFGLIFVAYNSFWLLPTAAAQAACLACARQHMAAGGRFILDVFPPVADDHQDETGIAQRLSMAARGRAVLRVKDYRFDTTNGLGISDVRYYGEVKAGRGARDEDDDSVPRRARLLADFRYALRLAPPDEVRRALTSAGFRVVEEYGTYEKAPLEPDSPRALFVCEA